MSTRLVSARISRAGFTLVEILIVVVIMGILAAIVVPKFARAGDQPTYEVSKSFERALDIGYWVSKQNQVYSGDGSGAPASFKDFVQGDGEKGKWPDGGGMSTMGVPKKLRRLLKNPEAEVIMGTVIMFEFKSGLVAEYTLDAATGRITATYTGPGAP
jgi:prepilin-type N-terminal cleavage/methylation domain-containing protein